MTKFIDTSDNTWEVKLNVGKLETLKAHGIDVETLFNDPKKLAELFLASPNKLGEFIYILLEKQIKDKNMSEMDFAELMDRETLDKATDAIITEIVLFFQRGAASPVIRENLPSLLGQMDQKIIGHYKNQLEKASASFNTATKSGASLESAPEG